MKVLKDTLSKLESLGTAQNRKVYARHGVTGPMYGVSYAEMGKLKKSIGTDHALALALWDNGNHDARLLATIIADPDAMTAKVLDAWAADLDNYVITDAFSKLAAATPVAHKKMEQWMKSPKEYLGAAGWTMVALAAMRDGDVPDAFFEARLKDIESKIHKAKNRTKYSMNNALLAIGLRNERFKTKAIAVAKRIGKVDVDHGETGCKTPDAVTYIEKAFGRGRSVRKAAAKKKAKSA